MRAEVRVQIKGGLQVGKIFLLLYYGKCISTFVYAVYLYRHHSLHCRKEALLVDGVLI